jgi:hypothetical protein
LLVDFASAVNLGSDFLGTHQIFAPDSRLGKIGDPKPNINIIQEQSETLLIPGTEFLLVISWDCHGYRICNRTRLYVGSFHGGALEDTKASDGKANSPLFDSDTGR